jgi:hypothetical protein
MQGISKGPFFALITDLNRQRNAPVFSTWLRHLSPVRKVRLRRGVLSEPAP